MVNKQGDASIASAPSTRQEEWRSFLFFTVVMAPVLAVIIVAGYGFIVWIYQMFAGPPGS
jgi:periplasmic nitrate reductase NapE